MESERFATSPPQSAAGLEHEKAYHMPMDIQESLLVLEYSANALLITISSVLESASGDIQRASKGLCQANTGRFWEAVSSVGRTVQGFVKDAQQQRSNEESQVKTASGADSSTSTFTYKYNPSLACEVLSSLIKLYDTDVPNMGHITELCRLPYDLATCLDRLKDDNTEISAGLLVENLQARYGSSNTGSTDASTCVKGGWADTILCQRKSMIAACTSLARLVKIKAGLSDDKDDEETDDIADETVAASFLHPTAIWKESYQMPEEISEPLRTLNQSATALLETVEILPSYACSDVQISCATILEDASMNFKHTWFTLQTQILEFTKVPELPIEADGNTETADQADPSLSRLSSWESKFNEIETTLAMIYNVTDPKVGRLAALCKLPLSIAFALENQKGKNSSKVSLPKVSKADFTDALQITVCNSSHDDIAGRSHAPGGWADRLLQQRESLIAACSQLKVGVAKHAISLLDDSDKDLEFGDSEHHEPGANKPPEWKGKERADP